jgi:uncharacterized phage-associated protein
MFLAQFLLCHFQKIGYRICTEVIMLAQGNHTEKLISAIIFFTKNATPRGQALGLTKLMKLLYFLDFWHYKETGFSVTGQEYSAWPQGPVPADVWSELRLGAGILPKLKGSIVLLENPDVNLFAIRPTKQAKFNESLFTKRELRIMNTVAEIFMEVNAAQISEASHMKGKPWQKTLQSKGEKGKIDYDLILSEVSEAEANDIKEYQTEYQALMRG